MREDTLAGTHIVRGDPMRNRWFGMLTMTLTVTLTMTAALGVTACGSGNTAAQASGERLPAGVVEVLPQDVAGAPMNLRIPPLDRPSVTKAVHNGETVNISARARWRGSTVTLYYLPRYNLKHEGTHFKLVSAQGVQRIGKYPIDQKGNWTASWGVGDYSIPQHKPMYLLAVTDAGQVGLVQMDTI